jgi:hypothetical protein
MKTLFSTLTQTYIDKSNTYLKSYPHLISFAASKNELSESDVVALSHMVYGWMPTILKVGDVSKLPTAVVILNEAKNTGQLSAKQLQTLKQLVNNSIVGVSKLLHFINPEAFPIWDSKIYQYCYQKKAYNNANNVALYLEYVELLRSIITTTEDDTFYDEVNKKLGYPVTKMRALELVMFLNSPSFPKQNKKTRLV